MKFIDVRIFFISLLVGLFLVYISTSPVETIYIFPTPENVDKFQYKDHADHCFSFVAKEVDCNSNKDVIEYPMQYNKLKKE